MKNNLKHFFILLFTICFSSVLSQDRIVITPDNTYSEFRTKRAGLSLLINKAKDLSFNGEVFIDFGIDPDNLVSESVGVVLPSENFNEKNYFSKRYNLDPGQKYYFTWRLESVDIVSLNMRSFNTKI